MNCSRSHLWKKQQPDDRTTVTLEITNRSRPQVSRGKILPVASLQRVCRFELESHTHQVSSRVRSTSSCSKGSCTDRPWRDPLWKFPRSFTTNWNDWLVFRILTGGYINGAYVVVAHCTVNIHWITSLTPCPTSHSLVSWPKYPKRHPHGGGPVKSCLDRPLSTVTIQTWSS